jgi:deaminated glutathione amidase
MIAGMNSPSAAVSSAELPPADTGCWRVAAVQMVSSADVAQNLGTAERLTREAAQQGAQLVLLPEYFCLMGQRDDDKLAIAEQDALGPMQQRLAALAAETRLWLVAGTLPLRGSREGRVFNSSLVFAPDGQRAARYDKMHLFAFDNGRERYDEGRVLQAGAQPVRFEARSAGLGASLHVGLSVCYDLRFPELYRGLSAVPGLPPCDLLCVPAAFTHTTGQAHWELLLRARAVENQCYVLASAQGGRHENGRRTFGHSMLIDPWGEVLDRLPEGEGVVCAEVSLERLRQVRSQLPALAHRRL